MKNTLISAAVAARHAQMPRQVVIDAMTTGSLKWKRKGRTPGTTETWIKEWIDGR
jgi:hypothetical protein